MSARLADLDETDVVLGALGDATRRGLLRLVRDRELSAGHLAAAFPLISRPAVSQHLRVLCDAGLVSARVDGRHRFFRARSEALAPVSQFIAEMWTGALPDLKMVAERAERAERGNR